MNRIIPSLEKERLIRLFLFHRFLEIAINEYAAYENDKTFMANIRRGKSFLKKALDQRLEALDTDAEIKLISDINKVGFAFLPKLEAKREMQRERESKDFYHIHKNAMHDWVAFTIESTCKVCQRSDFDNCPGRKVMMEHDIPDNPGAQGCQYSYVEVK